MMFAMVVSNWRFEGDLWIGAAGKHQVEPC
jgi:hypothetical protein